MKISNIILTLILVIVATVEMKASEKILFTGSVNLQNSVYKGTNLEIEFKELKTNQVLKTKTNYWGQYSISLFKGMYEVVVKERSGNVIYKNVLSIPTASGAITLKETHTLSGELYTASSRTNFLGYTILIEGIDKYSVGYTKLIEVGSEGAFSETLQSGNFQVTVKDPSGATQLVRTINFNKDKSMDFVLASVPQEVLSSSTPVAKEEAMAKTTFVSAFLKSGMFRNFTLLFILSLIVLGLSKVFKIEIKTVDKPF